MSPYGYPDESGIEPENRIQPADASSGGTYRSEMDRVGYGAEGVAGNAARAAAKTAVERAKRSSTE